MAAFRFPCPSINGGPTRLLPRVSPYQPPAQSSGKSSHKGLKSPLSNDCFSSLNGKLISLYTKHARQSPSLLEPVGIFEFAWIEIVIYFGNRIKIVLSN